MLPAHDNNIHIESIKKYSERPFVFTNLSFLSECISECHNGNHKDFFAFFRKKLQGKSAIRDIGYL